MTRWGVGPKFALGSILYGLLVLLLNRFCFPTPPIVAIPRSVALTAGAVLFISGMAMYVVSVVPLTRAFNEGRLETGGIYAYVRHPLYACFILFIIPAIVLLTRSLPGLTVPIVIYFLFRILIREEEGCLEEEFGEEYLAYKKKVGAVFPRLF